MSDQADYYSDIQRQLDALGVGDAMHLFVHSGLRYLGKKAARPLELIQSLIDRVGDDGCILMPTYPNHIGVTDYIRSDPDFDVQATPAVTGVIPQLFMDEFPSRRSYHPWLSTSAIGKPEYVTHYLDEHHLAVRPYDELSPHFRLCSSQRGHLLLMGVEEERNSCFHIPDSIYWPGYPFRVYYDNPVTMRYRDYAGIEHKMQTLVPHRPAFPNWRRFAEDLNKKFPDMSKTVESALGYKLILINGPRFLEAMEKALSEGMYPYNRTYMYHPSFLRQTVMKTKRLLGIRRNFVSPR
jgi:aminoglycoside N3'-acetyltransferase